MTSKRVLLLGGHGKVSLLLTPLLVSRSWHVTSVIRDSTQEEDILSTVKEHRDKIEVLVSSLEDVKSKEDAKRVIDQTKPNCVVWSAGSGGKGGPSRTQAIDRECCMHYIRAAAETPSVTKFLLVSYLGSRRCKAPWWTDQEWVESQEINNGVLKQYYPAKLAADECLTAAGYRNKGLQAIVLRPGRLTDDDGVGTVSLGQTRARGKVTRSDVAAVAAEVLDSGYSKGWLDLLEGDEPIADAVKRVVKDEVDCVAGENVDDIVKNGY